MSDDLKWLLIIGCLLLILTVIILIVIGVKKNRVKASTEFPELLEALGGAENISDVVLNGSRISLIFESKKNLNKELIKENGVETIVVSNKKITLVIGKKASDIYKYLQKNQKEA